jgi:hypothetical protein
MESLPRSRIDPSVSATTVILRLDFQSRPKNKKRGPHELTSQTELNFFLI